MIVHFPGGGIFVPNNVNAIIAKPGFPVSMRAEDNLLMMAYWLRQMDHVAQVVTPSDVTVASVCSIHKLSNASISRTPKTTVPAINAKDWPKTIDALLEHFRAVFGKSVIPLAYVIRKNPEVPVGEYPSTDYPIVKNNMIYRATHDTQDSKADKVKVWLVM